MTAPTSTHRAIGHTTNTAVPERAARGRMIPAGAAVMSVVVRVAGIVPACLDLAHIGTPKQQLGLSIGTVLVYLRSVVTARTVAKAWSSAAVLACSLAPAVPGRRPLMVGPSSVAVLAQLAGELQISSGLVPAHHGPGAPQLLQMTIGPVVWEVCDATMYTSLLRAWRQAARLLEDNLTEDDEDQ